MKKFYCFIIATTLSIVLAPCPATADIVLGPTVNPSNGHTYYLLSPNSWTGAQLEAQSLGGNLVAINDVAESLWVLDFANQFAGVGSQVWNGLNRTASTPFEWVNGDPLTFINWAPGEPNNATGSEFYAAFYSVDSQFGLASQWNDAPNSFTLYSVVEANAVPEPSSLLAISCTLFAALITRRNRGRTIR